MRIISGEFRSRRLSFPKSKQTRPMMDRAKETIFNILGETLKGVRVLDLFAGSGSLGLEALSRGAAWVTFVERGAGAQKSIWANLQKLGLEEKAILIRKDVIQAIKNLDRKGETFGLIFLDPPYNQGVVEKILIRLDQSDIVAPFTRLVVHRSRQEQLPETFEKIRVLREKRIGQACLSFLSGGNSSWDRVVRERGNDEPFIRVLLTP